MFLAHIWNLECRSPGLVVVGVVVVLRRAQIGSKHNQLLILQSSIVEAFRIKALIQSPLSQILNFSQLFAGQ